MELPYHILKFAIRRQQRYNRKRGTLDAKHENPIEGGEDKEEMHGGGGDFMTTTVETRTWKQIKT